MPASSGAVPVGLFLERFLAHVEKEPALRHQTWFGVFTPEQLTGLLVPSEPARLREAVWEPIEGALQGAAFENAVAEGLFLDFRLYLADDLLAKVDRASMACSLEVRTPFLDHRLIEFAAGLPAELKVRRFRLKSLLKKAVEPWLPREIVYRQKRGFSVPIARWLRRELRPTIDDLLSESRLKSAGLFNAAFVRRMIEAHQSGRTDYRRPLWALLCFELWRKQFGVTQASCRHF